MNWLLLKNSLLVSSLATLLAVCFGALAALCLAGLSRPWRYCVLGLALMALALPPFLVTNCWLYFLGQMGVWHRWLPLNLFTIGGTAWILALMLWPIPMLAVSSAWRRLEPAQLESEPALTGLALLRWLLFPLARGSIVQAALLTFVLALNNFAVPAILQVKVFPAEMWVRFNTAFDAAGALRLSLPLVLGPLLLLLWLSRRETSWPHLDNTVPARLFRRQLGSAWFAFSGGCTLILCFLSVGLPLIQILSLRSTWTALPGAIAAGQAALWNSCWFAAVSATVILFLTLLLLLRTPRFLLLLLALALNPARRLVAAGSRRIGQTSGLLSPRIYGVVCNSFDLARLLNSLTWLPFLLPGVLLGIGLITVFNRPWFTVFYQSTGIVILALTIRYLALGWNTIRHAAQKVDRDLLDVARLDGASRWQTLRHALWPQIAPQVIAAWYIVFLLCLWDVESIILVVPPGGESLALRIFNLLHFGYNPQVNALCLTLLAVAIAPLLLWQAWLITRRWWRGPAAASLTGLLLLVALLIPACAPPPPNEARLQCQLFSRAIALGVRGVGVGQFNKPRSVAVDARDNLYAVDMTGRVQKFSSNGVFELSWQMPQTDLGKPKGMCRDHEGNIVVIEPHYSRVNHFSTNGTLLFQWGDHGTNAGQLSVPRAVAVNRRREIFVSEYLDAERVQKFVFDAPGKPPRYVAGFGKAGDRPGEFNRPEGICVDAEDRVYVADSCNHRIQVFSSDGKFLRAYGKPGKGKGELSYPYDICVDAAGRQYVCEFGNSRIQVFDAHDQPIEIIGGAGAQPGQFNNPWSVALDSAGNLYVADSQNHRVQKLVRR